MQGSDATTIGNTGGHSPSVSTPTTASGPSPSLNHAILASEEWTTRSEEIIWPPLLNSLASSHLKLAQLALPCVQKYVQALPLSLVELLSFFALLTRGAPYDTSAYLFAD